MVFSCTLVLFTYPLFILKINLFCPFSGIFTKHKAIDKKKLNLIYSNKLLVKCQTRVRFEIYKPSTFQIWV